ncbi:MAG: glycosyltransferase [Myxococcota bacterium]
MQLAIVLATVDRPDAVRRVITDVRGQLRPGDELVVIDQSATPIEAPDVRVIARSERSLPAARNAGIAATTAPIVVFFDDDVALHPGCLDAHRAAYADPTVGGAVGRIVEATLRPNARSTTNRVGRTGRIRTRLDGDAEVAIETLKGANMSLRRQALAEVGPFDPAYLGTALLEDADLSTRVRRAGWALRYLPTAAVDHHHLPTGGVRTPDPLRWRFYNTGYFVRRHHRRALDPLVVATHAAIAVRAALRAREPAVAPRLLAAFVRGWRRGAGP